jgi:uncharacterized membrane protein
MLRRAALLRIYGSGESFAPVIRITRICELGTLAATSNRSTLRRNLRNILNLRSVFQLLVTANVIPTSPVLVTLMVGAKDSSETSFPTIGTQHNSAILNSNFIFNIISFQNINSVYGVGFEAFTARL